MYVYIYICIYQLPLQWRILVSTWAASGHAMAPPCYQAAFQSQSAHGFVEEKDVGTSTMVRSGSGWLKQSIAPDPMCGADHKP